MSADRLLGSVRRRGLRARRLPRPRPRTLAAVAAILLLLFGGWMWLRDSSLVAVKRVTVTGVSGPDAGRIRRALIAAARNMTTLDVNIGQLRTAVQPYPAVKHVEVSTQFPHGMRIHVVEQNPVAVVSVGGRTIAVGSDGTLLHDVSAAAGLPVIPLRVPPGGAQLTGSAAGAVALLAAAPYAMLAHVTQVTTVAGRGLVAQLRSGPSIYFGDRHRLAAKWAAAAAVLADSGSAGATYIDVTDPDRPAAGGGAAAASAATAAASSSGASAASTAGSATSASAITSTGTSTSPGPGATSTGVAASPSVGGTSTNPGG